MRSLIFASLIAFTVGSWAANVSMPVSGSTDTTGRKVLTFIAKDPPGVRCNGNL